MFRTRTTTDEQLHFSRGAAREDRPHLQLGKPECDQSVRASQQREDRQENHQADNRCSHVPSILEMIGIPYVASGPLAHSLALDKVVTKMILRQHNIPTPDFAVLNGPNDIAPPDLSYPLIVKPKNEAVSFGLKIVNNDEELKEAAAVIYNEFQQPVLAEQYIEGREINVGLLGNSPPEVLPPVELAFGEE